MFSFYAEEEVIRLPVFVVLSVCSDWEKVLLYGIDYSCAKVESENRGDTQTMEARAQLTITLYSMTACPDYPDLQGRRVRPRGTVGGLMYLYFHLITITHIFLEMLMVTNKTWRITVFL